MSKFATAPSRLHLQAVLTALFVTFLWSTSWVLIKLGLRASLPTVTFAGLRYGLAWVFLDEPLSLKQILRLALVGAGTLVVQVWRRRGV